VSQRADTRFWIAPVACALVITALSGVALSRLSWSFVDLYNLLYRATALSWPETLSYAFGGGVEYRPLLIIGVKLAHQVVGLRAWFYKALVLLQFAAILAGLLRIFLPTTRQRAVAACIASYAVARPPRSAMFSPRVSLPLTLMPGNAS